MSNTPDMGEQKQIIKNKVYMVGIAPSPVVLGRPAENLACTLNHRQRGRGEGDGVRALSGARVRWILMEALTVVSSQHSLRKCYESPPKVYKTNKIEFNQSAYD